MKVLQVNFDLNIQELLQQLHQKSSILSIYIQYSQALIGGMFMQMYVCGFNQICDIELNKVCGKT